jgi:arylsulfatase B
MQKFSHIQDIHRRIFAAMLGNLDDSVGEVLQALEDNKLQNDTLVFFISDNGGPTRELTSSNLPLKGEKGSMYEGGIRIPFMMKWPGRVPANTTYDKPVISLDMFATATTAAGVQLPQKQTFDGVDLIPFLTEATDKRPHQTLFWRTGSKAALRSGDWKVLRNPGRGQSADWQLYNLAEDISEANNLADSSPQKRDTLIAEWERLNSQMIDPVWRP